MRPEMLEQDTSPWCRMTTESHWLRPGGREGFICLCFLFFPEWINFISLSRSRKELGIHELKIYRPRGIYVHFDLD